MEEIHRVCAPIVTQGWGGKGARAWLELCSEAHRGPLLLLLGDSHTV